MKVVSNSVSSSSPKFGVLREKHGFVETQDNDSGLSQDFGGDLMGPMFATPSGLGLLEGKLNNIVPLVNECSELSVNSKLDCIELVIVDPISRTQPIYVDSKKNDG